MGRRWIWCAGKFNLDSDRRGLVDFGFLPLLWVLRRAYRLQSEYVKQPLVFCVRTILLHANKSKLQAHYPSGKWRVVCCRLKAVNSITSRVPTTTATCSASLCSARTKLPRFAPKSVLLCSHSRSFSTQITIRWMILRHVVNLFWWTGDGWCLARYNALHSKLVKLITAS